MSKKPIIRFPAFQDDWVQRRLENLFLEFKSGEGITSRHILEKGEYPVYGGNGKRGYAKKYTHEGFYLLIGRQGALCGNINRAYGKSYISEHAIAGKANTSSDTEWLAQRLDYLKLNRLSESSAQPGLSVQKLKRFKIFVPQLREQQRISEFLIQVDQRISLLKKKKELLERYKKGVMQQLFPQAGSKNPQVRFKQEDGSDFPDWEEVRAKNLFRNHSNKSHNGDLEVLSSSQEYGMIPRSDSGLQIQSSEKSIKSYKIVEPNDFVISLRSFQGGIDHSKYLGICSPAYTVLKPTLPIDSEFYRFFFKKESFIERLSKTTVGIRDGKQITYENFGSLNLPYPCLKEQQAIVSFLRKIEESIYSCWQLELESTKYKRGLLQQMFV